jgi:glycosyltransferase involved in cell wall biosynthesis
MSAQRKFRALVLTPALHGTSPGQRFRVEQWAKYLEPEGFEFTFVPFEDAVLHEIIYRRGHSARKASLLLLAFVRRLAVLRTARAFDAVFLHREAALIGPAIIEPLLARQRVSIVFDFDDAIWVPYVSPANRFLSYLKCFGKAAAICRLSTHIIAGNRYLAEYAQRYNKWVTVIPTTIDTQAYTLRVPAGGDLRNPVTIGWTGSYSTVQHLDILRPSLEMLAQRCRFRLDVIGTPLYRIEGVQTATQQWRAESEVSDLQRFDIGIMPLPDDDWSRGKCGLKLLQCMALGIPVVGSPVGVNAEIVRDGVNGFLAATAEEWVRKLALLVNDPGLRRRVGDAGRRTVEERYAAAVWAPKVGDVLVSSARVA